MIIESTENTPAQKIGLVLGLVLIAIIGTFVYDFIQTYHQWLSHALFYLLSVLGVAAVLLIAAFTAYAVCMLWLRVESHRTENSHHAQNNAVFNATANQIAAGAVYLSEQRNDYGLVKFKHLPKHAKQQPKIEQLESVEPPNSEAPEIKTTLLSDIEPLQRLLIVGGQNAGKTTLLKHIAKQRAVTGNVLILDSHNHAGKWANDYRIVGHGRDYQMIERELKNLVAVMDSRYKEYSSGKVREREHELITVISDEWTTITENIKNLDSVLLPLLTESRKVGIDFIIACHSETATSLGLKGRFDLKKNFDAVLRLKNISGKRIIHLDNGEEILEYAHCGEFKAHYVSKVSKDFSNKLDAILSEDLIKSTAIIDKYNELKANNQFSWNKLSKAIYGNSNGQKVAEIKAILASHGIVTSQ